MSWRDHAACADHPTEWWFPDASTSNAADTHKALRLCAGCPVRDDCLIDALGSSEDGIRGGLHPEQRRNMRAGRRRECRVCGVLFWPASRLTTCCSGECRQTARFETLRERGYYVESSAGTRVRRATMGEK